MERMITANLQGVADLVIRRAQRQGFVVPREVREVLAEAGLSHSLWKDVVAVARPALTYRQGRYYYQPPVSPRVAREQSQQRSIQRIVRQLIRRHKSAAGEVERRGEERIDFIQQVKVRTEDQCEYTLLSRDLSATGIRLIGTRRFLGQKIHVLIPNPDGAEPWDFLVRVLWTCPVGEDLIENGGTFLDVRSQPPARQDHQEG
jgi:hypothetical protein